MKKIITIIAVMFTMFALSANPRFTLLDVKATNDPKYVNKLLADNDLERFSLPITDKTGRYVNLLKHGTWLIENNDELAFVSVLNGKPIYGTSVLIKYGKEEN